MPWIEFTDDFDFIPPNERRVTLSNKAGQVKNVTTECANAAKDAGKGKPAKNPNGKDASGKA